MNAMVLVHVSKIDLGFVLSWLAVNSRVMVIFSINNYHCLRLHLRVADRPGAVAADYYVGCNLLSLLFFCKSRGSRKGNTMWNRTQVHLLLTTASEPLHISQYSLCSSKQTCYICHSQALVYIIQVITIHQLLKALEI